MKDERGREDPAALAFRSWQPNYNRAEVMKSTTRSQPIRGSGSRVPKPVTQQARDANGFWLLTIGASKPLRLTLSDCAITIIPLLLQRTP